MNTVHPEPAPAPPGDPRPALHGLLFAALSVLIAALFFFPILDNYFFGDDLLNLYRIADWGFWRFVLTPYASHVLVLRNAVFAASYYVFGPEPRYFFAVVLLTHLLNVYLLFRVIVIFSGSRRAAFLGAVLWGISPVNEGTLGWYAVYGQALVGTGGLWLLARLGRAAGGAPVTGIELVAWTLTVIGISTLFGTGTGVAMAFPAAAWLILPRTVARARPLACLAVAGVMVPTLYFFLQSANPAPGWGMSSPPLAHLLSHWLVVLYLAGGLFGRGVESLILGRADVAATALAGLPALALFVAVLAAAAWKAPTTRGLLLACLGLAGSGYVMIALGRGVMVAGGMRAELVLSAARYHYLGPLFLAVALSAALSALARRWQIPIAGANLLLAASLTAVIGARTWTRAKIDSHLLARRQTVAAVTQLHSTIAAAPRDRDLYLRLPGRPFHGVGPMLVGKLRLFPGLAGVFIVFFPDNVVDGKRVYFVTDSWAALRGAAKGRRSALLLVAPKDVPAGQPVIDL